MEHNIETAKAGHANGISLQLAAKQKEKNDVNAELSKEEKQSIINEAAEAYGNFLTALGCNWREDPNSNNTPMRVAKAYVNDLWKGRFNPMTPVTDFPPDGYDGIVQESNIPLISMCSHHHQTIKGRVSIAYIPSEKGKVIGLSKMNRIVERFGRRGAIQEQLTVAIHKAVNEICKDNRGVAVHITATHNCVSCRGVGHQGTSMQTAKLTGLFLDELSAKTEFYSNIIIHKDNGS